MISENRAIVISPHPDDAVISLGQCLYDNYAEVNVFNVFNVSQEEIEGVMTNTGALRQAEDQAVAAQYGFKFFYGDFPDTNARGLAWDEPYRLVEHSLLDDVTRWLSDKLRDMAPGAHLFVPLNSGRHPDHILAALAFTGKVLRSAFNRFKCHVYADQPYCHFAGKLPDESLVNTLPANRFRIRERFKRRMLANYPSQLTDERLDMLTTVIRFEFFWEVDFHKLKALNEK